MSKRINDGLTDNQRYYRKNIEENRKKSRDSLREWRAEHPEANAVACRAYYERNAERERERARLKYQAKRKLADKTPEGLLRDRMRKEARRARMLGVEHTLTLDEWLMICEQFGQRCAYCGKIKPLEQDHVIPLSKGGPHTRENVVPACKPCNASKGNR